jgi:hypothetical protein
MKKPLILLTIILALLSAVSCQPVSRNSQRATATAYAVAYMNTAMQAAESGAMALCNIDFNAGGEQYIENICGVSTQAGCAFFTSQIAAAWSDLARSYSSERLECKAGTSRFLEEGRQFGMLVQYWQINLLGTAGWPSNAKSREYWVQVAEENGLWKLNRVLTTDEVDFYTAIEGMASVEQ